jgi:competence protein ComEA
MSFIKKYIYIIAGVLCIAAIGVLYAFQVHKPASLVTAAVPEGKVIFDADENAGGRLTGEIPSGESSQAGSLPDEPDEIKVYISGEVVNPGVYEAEPGARIDDILTLAGGFAANADAERINLAARVSDSDHIIVPSVNSEPDAPFLISGVNGAVSPDDSVNANGASGSNVKSSLPDGVVNINTATLSELQTLPGIGETIASYIVSYRESAGGFKTTGEIMNVQRIGAVTFDKIKDRITVD